MYAGEPANCGRGGRGPGAAAEAGEAGGGSTAALEVEVEVGVVAGGASPAATSSTAGAAATAPRSDASPGSATGAASSARDGSCCGLAPSEATTSGVAMGVECGLGFCEANGAGRASRERSSQRMKRKLDRAESLNGPWVPVIRLGLGST